MPLLQLRVAFSSRQMTGKLEATARDENCMKSRNLTTVSLLARLQSEAEPRRRIDLSARSDESPFCR